MGYDTLPQFCQRLRHIQDVAGQWFLKTMGQQDYSALRNTQLCLQVRLHVRKVVCIKSVKLRMLKKGQLLK